MYTLFSKSVYMELKIPPPLVALILGFLMWSVAREINVGLFNIEYQGTIALGFLFASIAIDLAAVIPFIKAKTTINPMKPKKATLLINTGIYQYSRNPMYLGSLVLLMALLIWLGNIFNLVVLLLFVGYITKFQIKPEEKVLIKLFSDDYKNYKSNVRRWL